MPRMTDLQYALWEVNRIRQGFGKKPLKHLPKGRKSDPWNCPIKLALQVCGVLLVSHSNVEVVSKEVGRELAKIWGTIYLQDFRCVDMPLRLQRFISKFDGGKYPELAVKPTNLAKKERGKPCRNLKSLLFSIKHSRHLEKRRSLQSRKEIDTMCFYVRSGLHWQAAG